LFTKDCLQISGTIPAALASQVSTALSQMTSAASDATSLDVTTIFDSVSSPLATMQGLSGNLLSTVATQVASAIALVTIPNEALPTIARVPSLTNVANGDVATVGLVPAALGGATQNVAGAVAVAGNAGAVANNGVSGVSAIAGNGGVNAGIGNLRFLATPDDAEFSGPRVTVLVHPLPAKQPPGGIVSAALSVFNGGSRGRRRLPERDSRMLLEDMIFCAENPDDESCY
jgi:hypothetical protein